MRKILLAVLVATAVVSSPAIAQEKTATITIENPGFLPVRIEWKTDDGKKSGTIIGSGKVPVGTKVTMTVRPHSSDDAKDFYVWGFWVVNDKRSLKGANTLFETPAPGDRIRCIVLQPAPDYTGACTRHKGVFVLVRAQMPKVLEPWASQGAKKLAKELAETVVQGRKEKGHYGKFLSESGVSLHLPSSGDDVPEAFRKMTVEQLTPIIEELLGVIRQQRPPVGDSIDQQLKKREFI